MKFPKGKGFELHCGLIVTAVLDDGFSLTGTFLGEVEERGYYDKCDDHDDHDKNDKNDKHDKHDKHEKFEKHAPIKAEVDIEPEFILLQLTEPFCETGIANFPVGAIVAVNVAQILFIGAGGEPNDDKHYEYDDNYEGNED